MLAVILAGGKGVRLRPLTDKVPKPMVTIGGKSLLEHHVTLLKKAGISKIWIASQYLAEVITDYFGDGERFGIPISHSIEQIPLGTAGCLKNPDSDIEQDLRKEPFLVVCGDNFTNFQYQDLIAFHKDKKGLMTLGLYHSKKPWEKGVVKINSEGKVLEMREKPPKEECDSDTVNSSIYVCEPEILDYISEGFNDFGYDVIPRIVQDKRVLWAVDKGYFVEDIGTFQGLRKARKLYKENKNFFE